ncbi:hypothetical protein [Solicola sp. PLA-1-18]|uniref:hypothetical protein n=1 Tax=Solicola sp. PLA-1-18 TaxID=3380532 RepID=UPI003B76028B
MSVGAWVPAALQRTLLLLAVALLLVGGAPRGDVSAHVAATSASDAVAPCALGGSDDHEVSTVVSSTAHQQCLRAPGTDVADVAAGRLDVVPAVAAPRPSPWTWAPPPAPWDGPAHSGSRAPPVARTA